MKCYMLTHDCDLTDEGKSVIRHEQLVLRPQLRPGDVLDEPVVSGSILHQNISNKNTSKQLTEYQ